MGLIAASALVAAHAAAAMFVATRSAAQQSRRQLGIALCLTIPLFGPALAIAALRLQSRGGSPALDDPGRSAVRRRQAALRDRKPLLERLGSDAGERRAALAGALNQSDPTAIEILRWTVSRADGEAVVDAALTLEELQSRHEDRIARAKSGLGSDPTASQLLGVADLIADLLHSKLADSTLARRTAEEARALYRRAADLVDGKPAELYERWARLELAAMRPTEALSLLEGCDEPADPEAAKRLHVLLSDARFAARAPAEITAISPARLPN